MQTSLMVDASIWSRRVGYDAGGSLFMHECFSKQVVIHRVAASVMASVGNPD